MESNTVPSKIVDLHSDFTKDFSRFNLAEKLIIFFDAIVALIIIFGAQRLIQTQFGKASLTFGISMLGIITILRVLEVWGPLD